MRSSSTSRNKQQSECRDQICSVHTQRRKTACSETRWKTCLCKGRKLSRAVGKKKTWLMFSCVSHPAPALFYLFRRKEQKSAKVWFNKQTRFPIHIGQPVRPMPAAISCSGSQIILLVDLKWPLKGPVVVVCCRFTISRSPLISGSLFFPKAQTYCQIKTQGPIDTWESFPHTKAAGTLCNWILRLNFVQKAHAQCDLQLSEPASTCLLEELVIFPSLAVQIPGGSNGFAAEYQHQQKVLQLLHEPR